MPVEQFSRSLSATDIAAINAQKRAQVLARGSFTGTSSAAWQTALSTTGKGKLIAMSLLSTLAGSTGTTWTDYPDVRVTVDGQVLHQDVIDTTGTVLRPTNSSSNGAQGSWYMSPDAPIGATTSKGLWTSSSTNALAIDALELEFAASLQIEVTGATISDGDQNVTLKAQWLIAKEP